MCNTHNVSDGNYGTSLSEISFKKPVHGGKDEKIVFVCACLYYSRSTLEARTFQ